MDLSDGFRLLTWHSPASVQLISFGATNWI
jgi:hypothetical protein